MTFCRHAQNQAPPEYQTLYKDHSPAPASLDASSVSGVQYGHLAGEHGCRPLATAVTFKLKFLAGGVQKCQQQSVSLLTPLFPTGELIEKGTGTALHFHGGTN